MAIYLKYEGMTGEVTAAGHEGWIECSSLQWGVGRGIIMQTGASKDREASSPSISEVTVTKLMDETTPYFFTEACVGKSKKVEIHLVKTGDTLESYMEYTLSDCMVSGYSVSTGGDRPSESISLNFTKVEMKYIPFDDKHAAMAPIPAGYDLKTAKMV